MRGGYDEGKAGVGDKAKHQGGGTQPGSRPQPPAATDTIIKSELDWQGSIECDNTKSTAFRNQALNQITFRAFTFMKGKSHVVHIAHSVGQFFGMSGLALDVQGNYIGFNKSACTHWVCCSGPALIHQQGKVHRDWNSCWRSHSHWTGGQVGLWCKPNQSHRKRQTKMGRWHGATFKEYFQEELVCYARNMSRMKHKFNFVNIKGNALTTLFTSSTLTNNDVTTVPGLHVHREPQQQQLRTTLPLVMTPQQWPRHNGRKSGNNRGNIFHSFHFISGYKYGEV